MKKNFLKSIILGFALALFFDSVAADHNKSLYIFGDSLSDVGNLYTQTSQPNFPLPIPPETRYYNGRFSNGNVAADYLWEEIGNRTPIQSAETFINGSAAFNINKAQAVSFAYGGSETGYKNSVLGQFEVSGLLGQVGSFRVMKIDNRPQKDALVLVWSGGNDYFNQFTKPQGVSPGQVVSNLERAVKNLHASGLRNFLIPNLPDLGDVPIAHIMGSLYGAPQIPKLLSTNTLEHNEQLDKAVRRLRKLADINIELVDIYSATKALVTPDKIVPGPAAGCLYSPSGVNLEVCGPVSFEAGNGLIYWDETHPTSEVHRVFADAMLDRIKKKH